MLSDRLRLQLPAQLQEKFIISVRADPYMLRATARFMSVRDPAANYTTELEGLPHDPRLPDRFLAYISLHE
jgi:hypothetical protein